MFELVLSYLKTF